MDDNALLKACEAALGKALGGQSGIRRRAVRADSAADAAFSVRLPGLGAATLEAIVKWGLRPAALPVLADVIRRITAGGRRALLCTDYVSPQVAERLRDLGIWYVDAAGNIHIREGGALFVYADGRRLPPPPAPRGQTYSEAGARTLYFLVRHGPKITATYRDIQVTTSVSLAKISAVFAELEARRILAVRGRGQYEVVAPEPLLDHWVNGFADRLAPRIEIATCRAAESGDLTDLLGRVAPELGGAIVGGEVGADLATHHLRANAVRLYVDTGDEARTRRALRLAPAQTGPITLCRTFAADLAEDCPSERGLNIAHASLLYAELLAADDARLGEAAARLRKERLAWTL